MATIEKTSSGKWRVTKMYKGKRYRISLTRKPSKAEAERLIWLEIEKEPEQGHYQSFKTAAELYIQSKDKVLSPSTISGYNSVLRNMPQSIKNKPISAITNQDIQISINEYAGTHSAKSVRNLSGFITAVMRSVRPTYVSVSTLPQKEKKEFYVPEDADVKRILEYSKGSRYEIPLWLAVYGLRRSEVCALTTQDLDEHNIITVNKAKVRDSEGHWHIKTTKTVQSTRKVMVSQELSDMIRALPDGLIYNGSPGQINEYLQATESKLGIEKFSLHKLRHYFAATAREVMPDSYVEQMGGWKAGSAIMKKVYDYTKEKQASEAQSALIDKLSKLG